MASGRGLQRPRSPAVELLSAFLTCALLIWILASLSFATRIHLFGGREQESSKSDGPMEPLSLEKNAVSPEGNAAKARPTPPLPLYDDLHDNLPPNKDLWPFTQEVYDAPTKHPNATVISWSHPRIVLIKNFLSQAEVDHLLATAESGYQRSEVVSDQGVLDEARTSYGAWLSGERKTAPVLNVEDRISETLSIPTEFGESIYVLRYAHGQKYEAHADNCRQMGVLITPACQAFLRRAGGPECGAEGGGVTCGDRIATAIMYLQSPKKGGATVFPYAGMPDPPLGKRTHRRGLKKEPEEQAAIRVGESEATATSVKEKVQVQNESEVENGDVHAPLKGTAVPSVSWYCEEDADVLRVFPQSGDAVLFFNYVPGETPESPAVADPTAVHAGCPPLEGTKIIATRWMRSAYYD